MRFPRWAAVGAALTLGTALTACGSSVKTVGPSADRRLQRRRAGRRRHADQVLRALDRRRRQHGQGSSRSKGYKTDLQYADDDIPNQLAQIENMITKGAKVLVIAVDRRHHADRRAAEGRRRGHQGHRLRPPDQRLAERRLLRHLRQLQGRRAAGRPRSLTALGPEGRQGGPVQHRAVRRLAGRQQRLLLLQRRDVGAASPTSTRASSWCRAARPAWTRSRPCAGTRRPRRRAWRTCSPSLLRQHARSTRVLSPYDGLSIGIISALKGVGYGTAGQPMPVVTGQDAEVPSVKSIIAGEQYSTIFKDTRELAKVAVDMVDAVLTGKKPRGQRHQDLQQRREGRAVLPAQAGDRRPRTTSRRSWSTAATTSASQLK